MNRDVRRLLGAGESIYRVRSDLLAEIRQALIVTQDQCEVCALSRADLETACTLAGLEGAIISLRARALYELPRDFRRVAEAAGVPEGDALAQAFTRGLAAVKARAQGLTAPRVVLLEWLSPPMVAGGWMPELARIAGGQPLVVVGEGHFQEVSWEALGREDPDVLVLLPCGFSVERTRAELAASEAGERLRELRATREGRTFIVDGNAYFNRPGPRLAQSAEILAGLLHPERFQGAPPSATFR